MKTLILSDVHLNVAEDGQQSMTEFTAFLQTINPDEVKRIVVLGDLFDFWFEYRHVIFSGYFEVLRAFADLRDHGVELHFVCGNHDFWAGRFLQENLHFTIHPDSTVLNLGGRRVLFVHGDGINPTDWRYRWYKKVARARAVVWLFSLLHPDWAMALGQFVSRGSRRMFTKSDFSEGSEVKPLQAYARDALAQGRADVVMCGHSHYPVREEHPTPNGVGLYINTGDWLYHRSYVKWDGVDFRMLQVGAEAAVEVAGGKAAYAD